MVAPEDEEIFRIFDLVCKQKTYRLERLLSSIHVVAKEEVICFWRETAILKQSKEVVILAMDIT